MNNLVQRSDEVIMTRAALQEGACKGCNKTILVGQYESVLRSGARIHMTCPS